MNIAQLLIRAARTFPEQPAVSRGERVWATYAQLMKRSAGLAAAFRNQLGLVPGERVAMLMTNCPEYLEVRYAVWLAGLVAVPMNAKLHVREFAYMLSDSGAKLCFATPDLAGTVAPLADAVPGLERVVEVGSEEYRALQNVAGAFEMHPAAPDDVAWLFYTSGTTGKPKGVMISHRNLLCAALAYFSDVDRIDATDSIVHAAPMSHGSGLYDLPHMLKAANQVIPESGHFNQDEVLSLCSKWQGVTMFLAPTMVQRLVARVRQSGADFSGLKTIVYGGGPMYVADIREALQVMGPRFVQIYGQGEAPMTITALSRERINDTGHPRYLERLASVGIAQSCVEVIVADEHDRPLPANEVGEVLVRGDVVMQGYWNNPQASAATLRNGWLHTGDVGSFDADGFLTLRDRSKDLIISGGSNIYPREVEEALLYHPAVAEASVVGRAHAEWGEEVVAFVVRRPAARVTEAELEAVCLERIARFKRPRRYLFVDTLPKNNYGKVLKTELRKRLAAENASPDSEA
ncbi:MAG: AMP-dependent synthetase [Betaproteobacteria bacterium SG8_40]|jgi:long-chain acyl-CoA synthetase|nr:MAG: AMP-dependent synthetase [Betaproteobacteria bacterium SG8_40]